MGFLRPGLTKTLMLVIALTAVSMSAWCKEVALVTAKSSSLQGLQSVEIAKAFKSSPAKWADGKEIVFVVKAPASSETKIFATKLLSQLADQLPAFFANAKKSFIIVATDEEVIKTVNNTPNAIGVIDLYSINGTVKVLKVDGKLPLEPGYLLHYN